MSKQEVRPTEADAIANQNPQKHTGGRWTLVPCATQYSRNLTDTVALSTGSSSRLMLVKSMPRGAPHLPEAVQGPPMKRLD